MNAVPRSYTWVLIADRQPVTVPMPTHWMELVMYRAPPSS
jgi:hypothetical protein